MTFSAYSVLQLLLFCLHQQQSGMELVRQSAAYVFIGATQLRKVIYSSSLTNGQVTWSYLAFTIEKEYSEEGRRTWWVVTRESLWCPDPNAAGRCFSTARTHLWVCIEEHLSHHVLPDTGVHHPRKLIGTQLFSVTLSATMHPLLLTLFRCTHKLFIVRKIAMSTKLHRA